MARPKRETITVHLRISADLHRQITESANSHSPAISLNLEVERRLHDSFKLPGLIDLWNRQQEDLLKMSARLAELERKGAA